MSLKRKIKEHDDLNKILLEALERANNAVSSQDYWDCYAEVQRIREEIADTEKSIIEESPRVWS